MSNRIAAQRSGSVRKTEPKDQGPVSKGKEKGLWNFLTWSFFLSQVVAAEQAAAASAQVAASGDDAGQHDGASAGSNAGVPLAPVDFAPSAAQDGAPASPTQALNLGNASLDIAVPAPTGPAHQAEQAAPEPDVMPGNVAPGVGLLQVVAGSETIAPSGHEQTSGPAIGLGGDIGHVFDALPGLPGIGPTVGEIVQVVEHAVAPVLGVVGDVVHTVEPIVEHVLAPVVGIVGDVAQIADPLLSQVVAPIAGELVQTIAPAVEHVLAPISGIVGDIAQTAVPAVEGMVSPVLGIAGDLGLGVAPVLGLGGGEIGPAGALAAPVVSALPADLLGSLLGPAASAAEQISAATPVAAGSGSLDFHAASPIGLGFNELFSGGGYTDYGLALHSGTSPGASSVGSGSLLTPALDEHLAITAADDDHSGTGHGQHLGLPSALEELHLRGLGDGISL
jgi:hypothetical protein